MKMNRDAAIGVFDSGVGGLTVLKELKAELPQENFIYFGDTARVPYGNKEAETVTQYAVQATEFLISSGVKAVVIACNTATAFALDTLVQTFDIPVIGVIAPGAKACAEAGGERVLVLATAGTVDSHAYRKAISKEMEGAEIQELACPLFVPIVEEGMEKTKLAEDAVSYYLEEEKTPDILVLGCTHYPLLLPVIQREVGDRTVYINPAEKTAKEVKKVLKEKDLLRTSKEEPKTTYYVSDASKHFRRVACKLAGENVEVHTIVPFP